MVQPNQGTAIPLKEPVGIAKTDTGKQKKFHVSKKFQKVFNRLIIPVALLIAWDILSVYKVFPPMIIPAPEKVWHNFVTQIQSGMLPKDLTMSLLRVVKGFAVGAVLGISIGILLGISARANEMLSGILNGIRQIPPIAWIPLFIVWFGVGDMSKIVLVAKGTFFPVLLNTIDGIRNADPGHLEVAQLYHIKKSDLIWKVYLPSAIPFVFVGLRLGAGMAWMSVVAAEMLASTSGIGYRINDAQQLMQSDEMIVDMIVIGLVGGLVDLLLKLLTKRITKWKTV
ncbi:MAG: ABC transporter permease [Ethanoligenens sp.]